MDYVKLLILFSKFPEWNGFPLKYITKKKWVNWHSFLIFLKFLHMISIWPESVPARVQIFVIVCQMIILTFECPQWMESHPLNNRCIIYVYVLFCLFSSQSFEFFWYHWLCNMEHPRDIFILKNSFQKIKIIISF